MFLQKKSIPYLITIIVLLILGTWGCDAVGELPGGGEGGVTLPEDPGAPEPDPTQAPPEPEPTMPPEPVPTNPPDPVQTPDSGDSQPSQNDDLITILLVIIVVGIVLGAIVFIISLLSRPREKTTGTAAAPPPAQEAPISEPITENTHLKNASPAVAGLYRRFVDLVKSYGPVSIVPTETRIDFQARSIFASVQFRLENLELQLILPRIVQDSKIVRVDTIGTEKYSHLIMIDSLDDYDAAFNTWLQEAYNLAS